MRGQLTGRALVWQSIGTEEPGDQCADSLGLVEDCTAAFYEIGPAHPSGWSCVLRQLRDGIEQEEHSTDIGIFGSQDEAKEAAQKHEYR